MKKIKIIPVLIVLAGLAAAVYLFLEQPGLIRDASPRPMDFSAVPDVFLTDIRQITYENGSHRWTLEAASARMVREKQQTVLNDLVMTVYAADGTASEITADEGLFSMETGNAEIYGNVIIDNGTFQIHTQSLQYRGKAHILSTDQPVRITSDTSSLTGDSMVYDLARMKAVIEGNVQGRF